MDSPACIRLPRLNAADRVSPGAYCLWPGHGSSPPGFWAPCDYPLGPREAKDFLASIARLSLSELETMRGVLNRGTICADLESIDEQAARARFSGSGVKTDGLAAARLLAQQLLLWRWLQEESRAEIAKLEAACALAEQKIPSHFREDAQASGPLHLEEPPEEDSWQPVVANAAFFIPSDIAILAEGAMARDLGERLQFRESGEGRGAPMLEAEAPLWMVLGHSRPAAGIAEPVYNSPRLWLILA